MPEPISFLKAKLSKSADRIAKAARLNSLIDAATLAAGRGDTQTHDDCLQQAQKLYEELNAYNPPLSSH